MKQRTRLYNSAMAYINQNWPVFPCKAGEKIPAIQGGFKSATTEPERIDQWWGKGGQAFNIGISPGEAGIVVLDLDIKNGNDGIATLGARKDELGDLPPTLEALTPSGGKHLFFKLPEGVEVRSGNDKLGGGGDVKSSGGYVLVAPSATEQGEYKWVNRESMALLPKPWIDYLTGQTKQKIDQHRKGAFNREEKNETEILTEIAGALDSIDPAPYDTWYKVGAALYSFGEQGFLIWDTWSSNAPNYDAKGMRRKWDSFASLNYSYPTIFHIAQSSGWQNPRKGQRTDNVVRLPQQRQPDIKYQREHAADEGDHIRLVSASRIEPKRLEWLWQDYIPKNALSLAVGMPKTGKTMLALNIAATISAGGQFPDGTQAKIGRVLFWSGEDDLQDTILPRLKAAGANLGNIQIVDSTISGRENRPFAPADDLPLLLDTIERMDEKPVLLVIDPIVSVVKEMNNALEVRRGLEPLRQIAQNFKMGILGITHFRKSKGESGLGEQIIGSSAFLQVPRVVFYTLKVPDSGGQCVFFRGDTNMAAADDGFSYLIDSAEADFPEYQMVIDTACVTWLDKVSGDELQALINPDGKVDSAPAQAAAEDLLKEFLTGGEKLKEDIDAEAERRGITKISLTRAKKSLGICHRKRKKSEPNAGKFVWYFPDESPHVYQANPPDKDDQVDKHDKHTDESPHVYQANPPDKDDQVDKHDKHADSPTAEVFTI